MIKAGLYLGLLTGAPVCALSRGLGLPGGNVRKEIATEPGESSPDLFSPSLTASLPLHSVGSGSGSPGPWGPWQGRTAEHEGWELLSAISEKHSQPRDDQGMAVSTWDSGPGSLKRKCFKRNRGPRRGNFEKIPLFHPKTDYCVS